MSWNVYFKTFSHAVVYGFFTQIGYSITGLSLKQYYLHQPISKKSQNQKDVYLYEFTLLGNV